MYKYKRNNMSNVILIDIHSEKLPEVNRRGVVIQKGIGYAIGIGLTLYAVLMWAIYGFESDDIIVIPIVAIIGCLFILFFSWLGKLTEKNYFKYRNEAMAAIKKGELVIDEATKTLLTPNDLAQRVQYQKQAEEKEALLQKEYRMRCNVCGQVTCYTGKDIKDNEMAQALKALSALSSVASTATGNYFVMREADKKLDRDSAKVKDYSRCPHCNSTDVTVFDEEQWSAEQAKAQAPDAPVASSADELKKFKELLDMGAISQEEFDAKKKQLLGL